MESKIDRSPAAQVLSAKLLQSFRIYVEGDSDIKYWRNILCPNIEIRSCNGWKKVLDTVNESNTSSILCIGIVDKDFRGIIDDEYDDLPENAFVTDDHDLEMMMYKTEAFDKIITNTYPKIKNEHITRIKNDILEIADIIGYLKIATKRRKLDLIFKKDKKRNDHSTTTGCFNYPNYEKVFVHGNIRIEEQIEKNIENLIKAVLDFNNAVKWKDALRAAYNAEKDMVYDKWLLGNGHDFTYVLMHLLKKSQSRCLDMNVIEEKLYLAYDESIVETNLYNSIVDYCTSRDIQIFKMQENINKNLLKS